MIAWSRRKLLAAVCALSTLVVLALQWVGPWQQVEYAARDMLSIWGRHAPSREDIVFLAIDEPSMTMEGVFPQELAGEPLLRRMLETGWPWPRDIYPVIIEKLAEAGAKVIAFDMMFPTPREGDDAFRAALEKYEDRVIVGSNFLDSDTSGGQAAVYSEPSQTLIPASGQPDHRVGFVNMWPDPDGVVRRVYYRRTRHEVFGMMKREEEKPLLSLSTRIVEKSGFKNHIPENTAGHLIRFPKPTEYTMSGEGFPPQSIYRILFSKTWNTPPYSGGSYFKDKIVLIGPYGNVHKDYIKTPKGETPGPIVHLAAVNAALLDEFLIEPPVWMTQLLVALGGFFAWLLAYYFSKPIIRFLALLGTLLVSLWLVFLLYSMVGFYPLIAGPALAMVVSSVVWLAWEQLLEQRERLRTRRTMERYMSKTVVKELLDNPNTWREALGGRRQPLAILFTDLRGFTTLTESGDSQRLVQQLNEYFGVMVGIVFEFDGRLDKFIGDAIMAVWGEFRSGGPADDVCKAVRAGLKMRDALKTLNVKWVEQGWPEFHMGVGINHGEVISGNMGCEEKMELTVIGDSVNLASRLEGATKEYGIDLLLGQDALHYARDQFHLVIVDRLQVKGKTQAVEIATVLGEKSTPLPVDQQAWLSAHEQASGLYRAGKFAAARDIFAQWPAHSISRVYVQRCENLIANPPEQWDGVYRMTKK